MRVGLVVRRAQKRRVRTMEGERENCRRVVAMAAYRLVACMCMRGRKSLGGLRAVCGRLLICYGLQTVSTVVYAVVVNCFMIVDNYTKKE